MVNKVNEESVFGRRRVEIPLKILLLLQTEDGNII